jgi:FkbM family methyltransferase
MISIQLNEFIPPILIRARNFFVKHIPISKNLLSNKLILAPYNEIPINKDVKWVLDIGANIGNLSITALVSYPDCKVVCFEPVKETFSLLEKNLNKFKDRAFLYNIALASITGEAIINLTGFNGANSLAKQTIFHKEMNPTIREKSTEKVALKRLDDIADELPSKYFDVVKIDVEGSEVSVLEGGTEFFKNRVGTVIIEVSLMRDASLQEQSINKIFDFMKSSGFYLYTMFDLNFSNDTHVPFKLTQMDCVFTKVEKSST